MIWLYSYFLVMDHVRTWKRASLVQSELLMIRSWGTSSVEPNALRSRAISDISSFSMVSIVSFYTIRVRALCVQVPHLGCINSGSGPVLMNVTKVWSKFVVRPSTSINWCVPKLNTRTFAFYYGHEWRYSRTSVITIDLCADDSTLHGRQIMLPIWQ